MRKTITVTKTDIAKGTCEDPQNCAVARALLRTFRAGKNRRVVPYVTSDDVEVTIYSVAPDGRPTEERYLAARTTKKLDRFINRFDAGKRVKPTSLTLNFAE